MKGEQSVPGGRRPTAKELPDRDGKEPPKRITPRAVKDKADAKESEAHRVYLWRKQCLEEAGMPESLAKSCAADPSIDLHSAVTMLEAGCSPESVPEMLTKID